MKNLVIILLITLFSVQLNAQQDPQYTQYMYNMNIINPAYTGTTEVLAVGALYRSQWVGLDGGPETFTFNIHSPVGKQVGLGLSVISDQIGPVNETNAYVDFADEFAKALSQFDEVILLDIYPARELPIEGVSSLWLLEKILNKNKKITQKKNLVKDIKNSDAIIVAMLGAGDIGMMVEGVKNELILEQKS